MNKIELAIEDELDLDTYYIIYNISKNNFPDNTIFQGIIPNSSYLEQLFLNIGKDDLKNYIIVPLRENNTRDMDLGRTIPVLDFIGS